DLPSLQPRGKGTPLQRATYQIVDGNVIAKTHFSLRRMNIDIDLRGMKFQKDENHPAFALQGVAHRTIESAVAHRAAIDEKVIASAPDSFGGQSNPPHSANNSRAVKLLQT